MEKNYSVTKADIVISVIIGAIAAVFIALSVYIFTDTNIRYKSYERVSAVTVNVKQRHRKGNSYYITDYKYSVDGKSYTVHDSKRHSYKLSEGSKVYGYYDPDNPKIFYPDKRYDGLPTSFLLSIFLIVCTIGSVIEMRTKADPEKAKALHGIIRGINSAVLSVLIANLFRWDMDGLMIFGAGALIAFMTLFDSIRKLCKLKDQYGYY